MASIEQKLTLARVAINNALVIPELRDALANFGYTSERIAEGQTLHQAARAQYQQKIAAYGDLRHASDGLDTTEQDVKAHYLRHVQIAQVALTNDRWALEKLHLDGKRKRTRAGWLVQAEQFYSMAIADDTIQQKLAQFSIPREALEEGVQAVAAVAERQEMRYQQQGTAQDATKARNNALKELDTWMQDFRSIARIALKSRPQLLEQLGIAKRG